MAIKLITGFEDGLTPEEVTVGAGTPTCGRGRPDSAGVEPSASSWALTHRIANPGQFSTTNWFSGNGYQTASTATTPYTVTFSSEQAGYEGWEAFDGLNGNTNSWRSAGDTDEWIAIDLQTPVTVRAISYESELNYEPVDFDFQGSTDGVTWVTLKEVRGGPNLPTSTDSGYVILDGYGAYQHYRFYIHDASSGFTYAIIRELKFYEEVTSDVQAYASLNVFETPETTVYGAFATQVENPLEQVVGEDPIIKFDAVEVHLSPTYPGAKGVAAISGGNNVLDVFKSVGWVADSETSEITSRADSYGNFDGAPGVFQGSAACEITSGVLTMSPGDYYVLRVGSTFVPYLVLNVGGTPTTLTGSFAGTYKMSVGTADVFKITVPDPGGILESTETTPIHLGETVAENATPTTTYWVPCSQNPLESEYYDLQLDDGQSVSANNNGVRIRNGHWAQISFNIDLSSTAPNSVYVRVSDSVDSTELGIAMTTATGSAQHIDIRGIVGNYSALDDIRIDDTGTPGTPILPPRCQVRFPFIAPSNDFSESSSVTTIATGRIFNHLCPAPNGFLYFLDSTGVLYKMDPYDYSYTSLLTVDSSVSLCPLVYNPNTDSLFAVGNDVIVEVNYKADTWVKRTQDIDVIATTPNAGTQVVQACYVPQHKACYFVGNTGNFFVKVNNFGDIKKFDKPTNTESENDGERNLIYEPETDSLVIGWGQDVAKINLTLAEAGATESEYFKIYDINNPSAYNIDNLFRAPKGCGYDYIADTRSNTTHSVMGIKKFDMNNSIQIFQGLNGNSRMTYSPRFGLITGPQRFYAFDDVNGLGFLDATNYPLPSDFITHNPITGEIISGGHGGAQTVYRAVNTDTTKITSLAYRDNIEASANTSGDSFSLNSEMSVSGGGTIKSLGRNLLLGNVSGGGGFDVSGNTETSITGISITPKNVVVKDYADPAAVTPEIAWYGDHLDRNLDSNVPKNHGTNTSVAVTTTDSNNGGVYLTASGVGSSHPVNSSCPRYWDGKMCIFTSGWASHGSRYNSHSIAASSGEFSVNIVFSLNGTNGATNITSEDATLFTTDLTVPLTGANAITVHKATGDAGDNIRVGYFGNTSAAIPVLTSDFNMLTVGRDSGGNLVITLNGVPADTIASQTTDVNWEEIALLFATGNDSGFGASIFSFGVYPSDYVVWPHKEGAKGYWSSGPPLKVTNV